MSSPIEQIKSRLNLTDIIQSYVKLQKAGSNFKANCPFHNEKTPSFFVSPAREVWHCFGCFPPGQKIKTPFGLHNIEDIDENHYVYSGKGNIRKILAIHKRSYKGDLIDLKIRKLGGIVSMTADHKLRILRPKTHYYKKTKQFYKLCKETILNGNSKDLSEAVRKYGELIELKAGDLMINDFVFYPINDSISESMNINLKDYLTKFYTFGPRPKKIPYEIEISNDFLKLIGYWIAEGSNHRGYIRFSLGSHEEKFAKEIIHLVKKIFRLDAKIHKRAIEDKTGLEITACHSYLANIFENLCGKGAENKHIPFIFQTLSPVKQKILIEAIFRGDGHFYIANRSTKKHKVITTVSRILAEQIIDILLRNNLFPCFYISRKKIDNLGVNHKEVYRVVWSEEAKSQHNFLYEDVDYRKYWLLPIKKITRQKYTGLVYNLTVEKDHSYIATNFAVTNCGAGGDLIEFVKKIEGVEFPEALQMLADRAGVELKKEDPRLRSERTRLFQLLEAAVGFYRSRLEENNAAQEYLAGRGLKPETIKDFRIGFAPDGWREAVDYLRVCGFTDAEIEKAGLGIPSPRDGKVYDRFRGRIMFPISDFSGRVIGFSGRIVPFAAKATKDGAEPAKYINTPQTVLYDKSRSLYGFDKAKLAIRKEDACILVEGQMDVAMAHQAGLKNVVGISGTALTEQQYQTISRLASRLIISLDKDSAGIAAAKKSVDLKFGVMKQEGPVSLRGGKIMILDFGTNKDAAELVMKEGAEKLREAVKNVKNIIQYFIDIISENNPAKEALRSDINNFLLPLLANLDNEIEISDWTREISRKFDIKEDAIWSEIKKIKSAKHSFLPSTSPFPEKSSAPANDVKTRKQLLEERILGLAVWKKGETLAKILKERGHEFFSDELKPLVKFTVEETIQFPDEHRHYLHRLAFETELLYGDKDINYSNEIKDLFLNLEREHLKNHRAFLAVDIQKAEKNNDQKNLLRLINEFNELSKKLV